MKTVKWIIFCISVFAIYTVEAQNETTLRFVFSPDSSKFVAVKNLNKKIEKKTIKKINFEGDFLLITCPISDTESVINDIKNHLKEFIIAKTCPKPEVLNPAPVQEPEPVITINDFLDIEDSTIFTDEKYEKFMELDSTEIHPRSYNYFCLIRHIRQFKEKLIELAGTTTIEKNKTKQLLVEADDLYSKIVNNEDVRYLTQAQKDYFNERLLKDIYIKYENDDR